MSIPTFNLLVIRSPDIEVSHRFYSALGFTFEKHAHGSGPIHYASEQNGYVFEIYPGTAKEERSTGIRLGIEVSDITASIEVAKNNGASKVSAPKDSDWGIMAVVEDPYGIPVHLIQKIRK